MIAPVLFLGHGSPLNAIGDNPFRRAWQALGAALGRVQAILCISAHWETRGVYVTTAERPETIHDFYGFPKALFDVRYPAPGSPALAARVQSLLEPVRVHADPGRGLDHGAWSVLAPMYPAADVPVVQLSLDTQQPAEWHYQLAGRLAPLREEGILVLASGNIVHNLMLWRPDAAEPYDWARRFDAAIAERILAGEHHDLIHRQAFAPDAHRAVPTPEHFLPLLYALALQRPGEPALLFNRIVQSSISMTSVVVGDTRFAAPAA